MIIGLDQEENHVSGSDTIILAAVRLNGKGATLISVPRDAYVSIPHRGQHRKINASYAEGKEKLLRQTLAQSDVMAADLPYYATFDSSTVAAMVDALGGIDVVVPCDMNYDDNWGRLHIHLNAENRHLNGVKTVGFLRWRKNNYGRGAAMISLAPNASA